MIRKWLNKFKIDKAIILSIPLVLNFFKSIVILNIVPTVDFGRFSLYTSSAAAIAYLFNSGFYEGSITYFTALSLGRRNKRIVSLSVRLEVFSFVILFIVLTLVAIFCFLFKPSEALFFFGTILSSYGQSHLNLTTSYLRIKSDFTRLGYIMLLRSGISFFIMITLIKCFDLNISQAYFCDGVLIAIVFLIYIYKRLRLRYFFRILETVKIARLGFWQCYASAFRSLLFSVERFAASVLLSPTAMGQYAKLMVFYQVAVTGGGLISQIFQQRIVSDALSKGVKSVGFAIIKLQLYLISTISVSVLIISLIIYQWGGVAVVENLGLNLVGSAFTLVLLSGLIEGTSVFDSLALASDRGFLLIQLRILVLLIFLSGLIIAKIYFCLWTTTHQSVAFLILTILNYFFSVIFIYLHRDFLFKVSIGQARPR